MKKIVIIILLVFLGLFAYKTFFDNETTQENKNITTIQIDTVFIESIPDTVIKKQIKYVYNYIDTTDYETLNILNDSLLILEKFLNELRNNLKNKQLYTLYDTTTFKTGDSIETEAIFWPINKITYMFFPSPKQIITKHKKTIIYEESKIWFSLLPVVGIGTGSFATDINLSLYILNKKYIIGPYVTLNLQNNNIIKGFNFGIRFDIDKPKFKIF